MKSPSFLNHVRMKYRIDAASQPQSRRFPTLSEIDEIEAEIESNVRSGLWVFSGYYLAVGDGLSLPQYGLARKASPEHIACWGGKVIPTPQKYRDAAAKAHGAPHD